MLKRVVHSGEILKDELAELGVTPTTFARQTMCRRTGSARLSPASVP